MKYYLYEFSDNWADEMDVQGFAPLTHIEKEIVEENINRKFRDGGSISFGTNEDNDYDDLEDVIACVSFTEISKSEYLTIKKLFGESYGELGPIDSSEFTSLVDIDSDFGECDECGDSLREEDDDRFCESCSNEAEGTCSECGDDLEDDDEDDMCAHCYSKNEFEEAEYDKQAKAISKFIEDAFGINPESSYKFFRYFKWNPTPKAELEISIDEYENGEEISIILKQDGRQVKIQNLDVSEYFNRQTRLKGIIQEFLDKAKQYYN
jgi:hypothetical protein